MRHLPLAILALTTVIVATTAIIGRNYANQYLRGMIDGNDEKVKQERERQMSGELFLEAVMAPYPGKPADPNVSVEGKVTAIFQPGGSLTLQYTLRGLQHTVCECCGIHIHQGKSCEDHTFVGDHHWNAVAIAEDVWNAEHKACYTTQANTGFSTGSFGLYSGHGYEDNTFHAVVVHNDAGLRIGCGILYPTSQESLTRP